MKTLGLTGGIGMGKSTAAEILQRMGIPTVDTDQIAREIVQPGQPALADIRATFGHAVLDAQGALNRSAMADIVFGDAEARRQLEAITHPRIRERWQALARQWRDRGHPLAVIVIPLLFETQSGGSFDVTVCAARRATTQWARLRARGWDEGQVRRRIRAQLPIEEKMRRADFVLWNEPPPAWLEPQLQRIRCSLQAGPISGAS